MIEEKGGGGGVKYTKLKKKSGVEKQTVIVCSWRLIGKVKFSTPI
jgi:hypothetical protein